MVKPTNWQGPKRKNLHDAKEWIMQKLEDKGEIRWTELWGVDQSPFKSQKHLVECLEELQEMNIIEKVEISHKNKRYIKAGSFDLLKNLIYMDRQAETIQPRVLKELSELNKKFSNPMQRTAFITYMTLMELRYFFFRFERTLKTSTQLYTKWGLLFLGKAIRRFGNKIVTSGRSCPEETENALKLVYWTLQQPLEELSKATNTLPPQQPLPGIDQKQIQETGKYYERLLATLAERSKTR